MHSMLLSAVGSANSQSSLLLWKQWLGSNLDRIGIHV